MLPNPHYTTIHFFCHLYVLTLLTLLTFSTLAPCHWNPDIFVELINISHNEPFNNWDFVWCFITAVQNCQIFSFNMQLFSLQGLSDCHMSSGNNTNNTRACRIQIASRWWGRAVCLKRPLLSTVSLHYPNPPEEINITHVQLKAILCCSARQDCKPCLQITITVQGLLGKVMPVSTGG